MSSIDLSRRASSKIQVARVNSDLPLGLHAPKKDGDIGWDLEAMETVVIGPMQSMDVPVNARIALPENYYADIRNRSSMARRGLYVDQNLIDTGYRGRLFVFIRNMQLPRYCVSAWGGDPYIDEHVGKIKIEAGERIAQLVFHKLAPVWTIEVDVIDTLTERGEDGFGSTGR